MSTPRMLAVLAAVLSFGALVAVLPGYGLPTGVAAPIALIAWLAAVAIAAVILAPVAVIRRARPPRRLVAAALVFGGLLVYPVYDDFYTDAYWAAEGGGVGRCEGFVPLAEAVQNHIADSEYARVSLPMGCDD
jgi:hypothetical protein